VEKVKDRAERAVVVDNFEPMVPLKSELLLDPVEWLISLNEGILRYVKVIIISRLYDKELLGWTERDKESFRSVKNSVSIENRSEVDISKVKERVNWKLYFVEQTNSQRRVLNNVIREPDKCDKELKFWNEEHLND
jgi:hypothetical protein